MRGAPVTARARGPNPGPNSETPPGQQGSPGAQTGRRVAGGASGVTYGGVRADGVPVPAPPPHATSCRVASRERPAGGSRRATTMTAVSPGPNPPNEPIVMCPRRSGPCRRPLLPPPPIQASSLGARATAALLAGIRMAHQGHIRLIAPGARRQLAECSGHGGSFGQVRQRRGKMYTDEPSRSGRAPRSTAAATVNCAPQQTQLTPRRCPSERSSTGGKRAAEGRFNRTPPPAVDRPARTRRPARRGQ